MGDELNGSSILNDFARGSGVGDSVCPIRLSRLPPLGTGIEALKKGKVSGDFVAEFYLPLVDDGEEEDQPLTLFHENGLADLLNNDDATGIFNKLDRLSRLDLILLAYELLMVTCGGLFSRKKNKTNSDGEYFIPKQAVHDTFQSLQVIFCKHLSGSDPGLSRKFSEWQQSLSPTADFWKEFVRQFQRDQGVFCPMDFQRGVSDQSTQTVDVPIAQKDIQSIQEEDEFKSLSPTQQTSFQSPPHQKREQKSSATGSTTTTIGNTPKTPTFRGYDRDGAQNSVFVSPPSASASSTPHFVFCRVRNAREVSGVKLLRQWDAVLGEIFEGESSPQRFSSKNIREIKNIGETGVALEFVAAPSQEEIDLFAQTCVSDKGQTVLKGIFETNSTIGAAKFIENHSPSPARRVGNRFYDPPNLRKTSQRRTYLRQASPIRRPNFSRQEISSNPTRGFGQRRQQQVMPQRQFNPNLFSTPPMHQLQILQQQMQSIMQIQQQMLSFMQSSSGQLYM